MSLTRRPVQIVGLVQRRCSLRFGVAPCMATGTPKCHQTWGTCRDRDHIDTGGSITWLFCKPGTHPGPLYARDGEHIRTNAIPLLESVTTASVEINVASQRTGVAPLGVGATVTVNLINAPWDDHVGDFYRDERAAIRGTFWGKWRARNAFFNGMQVIVWEGYEGDTLEEMTRRDYMLRRMPVTTQDGATLEGEDPLRLTEAKEAKFPAESSIELAAGINASTTAIRLSCFEDQLSADFGNTGARRYLRIGDEIILYTGWTAAGAGLWDLTGVTRGALGSQADSHAATDSGQRAGRYENIQLWRIAADLIDSHTPIPAGYRDGAAWDAEGYSYMISAVATRTVVSPTGVDELLGQLCQQGGFSIWWDERQRTIPLLANRPPSGPVLRVDDATGIIEGSASVADDPDIQITRVAVYYAPRNAFDSGKPENYRILRLTIDGYVEDAAAVGAARTLTIYADWLTRDADAMRLAARILMRYRLIPQYLTIGLDAKDSGLQVGDVLDVTTGAIEDSEGNPLSTRWQVIAAEVTSWGHALKARLQSYRFIGRFAVILPAAAPDYADASEAERREGCWLADETTGRMPNGDEPYLLQ